jgi:hypothetical protein
VYQNPYHLYQYPYPYAYYPSHSPHSSKNKISERIEQPTVKQELTEAQPVSYPVLSQEVENEESSSEKVDTFTSNFLDYLTRRKGSTISVTTSAEVIRGTLEEVASDCILVKAHEESYHIRPERIIYFK